MIHSPFYVDREIGAPQTPELRQIRWQWAWYPKPQGMTEQEYRIRNILGSQYDLENKRADRFFRPIRIQALSENYDIAETFLISLVGSPPRGVAMVSLEPFQSGGWLTSTYEMLDEEEYELLVGFIHTVFGTLQIPIGIVWSDDKDFPSGKTWSDIPLKNGIAMAS